MAGLLTFPVQAAFPSFPPDYVGREKQWRSGLNAEAAQWQASGLQQRVLFRILTGIPFSCHNRCSTVVTTVTEANVNRIIDNKTIRRVKSRAPGKAYDTVT